MDRLTVRGKQNKNHVYMAAPVNGLCKIQPNFCPVAEECDKNTKMISDRKCPTLQLVDRLAAYEDTGLSPAEVAELAQAKADGRVVVLPCKVGDTVYVDTRTFRYGEYAPKRHAEAVVTSVVFSSKRYIKFRIFSPYVNANKIFKYPLSSFGKTVFLTREEAEKALRESDNNA